MAKIPANPRQKTVLIVDDELDVVRLIAFHLTQAGFAVYKAYDGKSGLDICLGHPIDLVILDIMLPGLNGWEVCQRLKRHPKTHRLPIIILSALAEEKARVKGFQLGAVDYVVKPFSIRELVCRVKNILQEIERDRVANSIVKVGEITMDFPEHRVCKQGKEIPLSLKEFDLLWFLATNPAKVLKKEEIMDALWGQDTFVEYSNIDVLISHLRKKLEDNPQHPKYIITKRGVGYVLTEP